MTRRRTKSDDVIDKVSLWNALRKLYDDEVALLSSEEFLPLDLS